MQVKSVILQGRVRFPTGGTAREPKGMIRCDSGADSIVWMGEETVHAAALPLIFLRNYGCFHSLFRTDGSALIVYDLFLRLGNRPGRSFFIPHNEGSKCNESADTGV